MGWRRMRAAADALLYHAPNVCAMAPAQERPARRRPGQPMVVYSMESVRAILSLLRHLCCGKRADQWHWPV